MGIEGTVEQQSIPQSNLDGTQRRRDGTGADIMVSSKRAEELDAIVGPDPGRQKSRTSLWQVVFHVVSMYVGGSVSDVLWRGCVVVVASGVTEARLY